MASCSSEGKSDSDLSMCKCTICQDDFKDPKLLPCSHTFCKECLINLIEHQSGRYRTTFPCPYCREEIKVPTGGVGAFKSNYYLDTGPTKEKLQLLCKVHTSRPREVEMFCQQCQICICLKCKLEDHANHLTEDLIETSKGVKTKLASDMGGLINTISGLKNKLKYFSEEQKAVQDKKRAVKKDIHNRHKMMVSVADRCRDDALFALDTVSVSIESMLEGTLKKLQTTIGEVEKLKKRMESCLKGGEGSGLLMTAQEIYQDASRHEKEVQRLLTSQMNIISRPVLRYTATADVTLSTERKFLGGVSRMDMAVSKTEVSVKQLFNCVSADETLEVYSLCPRSDDKVWIAYEVSGINEDTAARRPQLFTLSGDVIESERSVKGRTSFTHTNQGTRMCSFQASGSFETYAKSRSLMKLRNHLNGFAVISEVIVENEDPLMTSAEPRFSILCGPHRAFDVYKNRMVFAVVEEAQPPETQRKVHMYQQPKESPVVTYCSPVQPFQPSDVCFYKLGGHNMLLVSDELNDVIHVVIPREGGQLVCGGYLAAGNPLITQPTALNTDIAGRLWIGCRTGAILLCQPASA